MSQLALSTSFDYPCHGPTAIIYFSKNLPVRGPSLDMESEVYRRQIPTCKNGSRTERVNHENNCC